MITSLADSRDTAITWMSGITGLIFLLIALALVVLVIAAVISALFDGDTTGGGKLLWIIFVIWFPLFGAIAWFVVGKKGHLNRFLGIDKGRARHTVPSSVGQHSNVPNGRNGGLGGAQAYQGDVQAHPGDDRPYQGDDRPGAGDDRPYPGDDRPYPGDDRLGMRENRSGVGYRRTGLGHV